MDKMIYVKDGCWTTQEELDNWEPGYEVRLFVKVSSAEPGGEDFYVLESDWEEGLEEEE